MKKLKNACISPNRAIVHVYIQTALTLIVKEVQHFLSPFLVTPASRVTIETRDTRVHVKMYLIFDKLPLTTTFEIRLGII